MNDMRTGCSNRPVRSKGRWRPQLSLTTLLLLVAAVATLVAYWQANDSVVAQKARLAVLRPLTQELVIHDASKITAVRRLPEFFAECVWDVHIPVGNGLRLILDGKTVYEFQAGKYAIEYRLPLFSEGPDSTRPLPSWELLVDGRSVIGGEGQGGWTPHSGDNDGGLYELTTGDPDKPFVLVLKTPPKILNGNWSDKLLWIE